MVSCLMKTRPTGRSDNSDNQLITKYHRHHDKTSDQSPFQNYQVVSVSKKKLVLIDA